MMDSRTYSGHAPGYTDSNGSTDANHQVVGTIIYVGLWNDIHQNGTGLEIWNSECNDGVRRRLSTIAQHRYQRPAQQDHFMVCSDNGDGLRRNPRQTLFRHIR
jgi:hypothetical protein